jgi:hypothetical protein
MFPGLTSKISEAAIPLATTIYPKTDLIRVTDTTSTTVVATITPAFGGFGGFLVICNRSGNDITTVTTGNILTAVTIGDNAAVVFIYSMSEAKWLPGALA